jgi:hypothetical protein
MTPGLRVVSRKDRSVQAAVNNGCLCDFYVSCTHIDDLAATEFTAECAAPGRRISWTA